MAQPAGVYFQYRADDATATYATATTTGGVVDSSGNARPNLIPGTSAQRATLNTGGQGGHSYLTFDGVDDRLTTGNTTDPSMLAFLNNKPGGTVAAVVRNTGATGAAHTFVGFSTGASTAGRMAAIVETTGQWNVQGRRLDADALQGTTGPAVTGTGVHLVVGVHDYTNAVQYLYVDGVVVAQRSPFQTAGNSSATNSQSWQVGCNTGLANFFAGDVYEVLGYDRALTATEVSDLWAFERDRYALGPPPATLRVLRAGVGTSGAATLRVLRAGVTTETSVLANAGAPVTVDSLDVVVLSAEASSGNPTGYTWTQTAGPAVALRPNGNVPRPEFTAPATDAGTTCTFSLAVTSGGTTSSNTATATVTVRPHIEWLWSGAAWTPVLTEVIRAP